jgi:hypothetical protein
LQTKIITLKTSLEAHATVYLDNTDPGSLSYDKDNCRLILTDIPAVAANGKS